MADKLIANIHATFDAYSQNIRPLIARICNHAQSQDNIASLFEQASDYLIVFEQDFEVNYYTLLKFSTDQDPLLATFSNQYELLLKFVGLVFSFALADMAINIDDYPVLEPLVKKMKVSKKHTDYCLDSLRLFMAGTHPQDIPPFVEDDSLPTSQNNITPVASQDHPTIKVELDNSLPTLQNPSTPVALQEKPTIKVELDNSPLIPQNPTTPKPNVTINIKAVIDIDSQPMEIETLYDPDMDNSDTDSNYDSSDSDYSDFEDLEGDFLEARARAYSNIFKHIPPVRHIDPFG